MALIGVLALAVASCSSAPGGCAQSRDAWTLPYMVAYSIGVVAITALAVAERDKKYRVHDPYYQQIPKFKLAAAQYSCALIEAHNTEQMAAIRALEAADRPVIHESLARALETAAIDEVVPWTNPQSGQQGTIIMGEDANVFEDDRCRTFHRPVEIDSRPETVYGHACQIRPGEWKVNEWVVPDDRQLRARHEKMRKAAQDAAESDTEAQEPRQPQLKRREDQEAALPGAPARRMRHQS